MAFAKEQSIISVGVVGKEVLVESLERILYERNTVRVVEESAKGFIELGLGPNKVQSVELEGELSLRDRDKGVDVVWVFEVI